MATKITHKKVRYAVVGLGHIAQVAVLPAFEHARRNSELAALISTDDEKLKTLSERYQVPLTGSYDDYEECLKDIDAVYIALPNSLHAEYTVRAANAGVHVLCEKPMAVTSRQCEQMIDAAEEANVKLMIAYRLHFERFNLEAVDIVKRGRIGEPKMFNSTFSLTVRPGDIRTQRELGGGTLYDIGVYCINAARYLFRSEPLEVMALSVNAAPDRLPEVDESTGAVLRFDGGRIATFVTSFNAADVSSYRIVGTEGDLHFEPAYEYAEPLAYELTINGRKTRKKGRKQDQFAPELIYFSDCVLNDRTPEPSGYEGLQDVRIIEALYQSAESGRAVQIPPYQPRKRPDSSQRITKPGIDKPDVVNVESPTE